jgi:ABC-2 type transport system ATP-binding protein
VSILAVKNLKKIYSNNVLAINKISFDVSEGEIFAFLGPNGAGKTTTVEILEGLREKTSGEIYFFGNKIDKINQSIKENIGVVLQKTSLMELLTVKETIKLFSSFYKNTLSYSEIIKITNLEEKENSKIKTLSGGQFQRLAIGLALVNNPKIIFLDEPTTGLDPQARRMIWELIKKLKEEGKSIFLTTHYMEEAEYLADTICIIDHGSIIAKGSLDNLLHSISKTKSIIEFKLKETKEDFENFPFNYKNVQDHCLIETDNVSETLPKIIQWFEVKKIAISNIDIHNPNLEDLFIQLTGKELRD